MKFWELKRTDIVNKLFYLFIGLMKIIAEMRKAGHKTQFFKIWMHAVLCNILLINFLCHYHHQHQNWDAEALEKKIASALP